MDLLKNGEKVRQKIDQPSSLEERCRLAGQFLASLKLTIPTVVDGMDDRVNAAYRAYTDRLVIVGTDGKIAYYGAPGPRGFHPSEVEAWLKANTRAATD